MFPYQTVSCVQMFMSAQSVVSGASVYQSMSQSGANNPAPPLPEPVQVAMVTGRQELKLKIKQNDTVQGPKVDKPLCDKTVYAKSWSLNDV